MWKRSNNLNMHGVPDIGPNVPAFLVKLWKLVEDPEITLINWSESGMSFIIQAQARFAREVLPMHYKHNNMASFIRQLNMYDFHKISSLESGGLRNDRDELEFGHQYFIRDHPYLLENIKRKMSNPRPAAAPPAENHQNDNARNGPQPDIFSRLLSDVNVLKGKQDTWDARLSAMKRENEALWRELAVFRQKHLKQEQIINRLIHFIVTIVQPDRKVPIPRRFPLMLNDTNQIKKIPKVNATNGSSSRASPPGPTIHEIEGDVLINGNEIREPSAAENGAFISASLSDPVSNVKVHPEPELLKDPILTSTQTPAKKAGTPDWLEIVLTEEDRVTPLTAVNPADVNPVVAAATLKHLETNNKMTVPVTMKIPAIITSDGNKRRIPEKKIIYLAEIEKPDKTPNQNQSNPQHPKNEPFKNKGIILPKNNISIIQSVDDNLELADYENAKILTIPSKPKAFGKRKLSLLNSPSTSEIPLKRPNFEVTVTEAASEQYSPLPTPNTLENLLNCNFIEANNTKDNAAAKAQTAEDSFWKLESLYNGSLCVNELIADEADEENPDNGIIEEVEEDLPVDNNEKTPEINISDVCVNDVEMSKPPEKNDEKSSDALVGFAPESMAVVCQNPSSSNEELYRELSAHVDNVQGEIDYLKEVIKGEGYNLDMNNLLGYFNEDPLSYGLLQTAEEEPKEKENDKVVTGNEVITYGGTPNNIITYGTTPNNIITYGTTPNNIITYGTTPNNIITYGTTPNNIITYGGTSNNLMELVDLFGSSSTVQDWTNLTAPTSPTVSELVTPEESPSPANVAKSGKRRKI